MRLTIATIRSLGLPEGCKDKIFFDDDLPGFGVRLRASGSRTWLVQYAIKGRTRRVILGPIAVVDPGKARAAAKDIMAAVRLGRDPHAERQNARIKATETFGALLPRFLERQRARLKPRSLVETQRHLVVQAKPLHGCPIESIDRRTIASRLAAVAKASGPAASNRLRTSLAAFFAWAAREGYVDANPVAFTNQAVENGPRGRVLSDDELAAIWRAAGDDPFGAIVRLLMLLGLRRSEVGGLQWTEFDPDTATITLPPARTKNGREFIVPLSEPALAILTAQPRREDHECVFARGTSGFQDWSSSKRKLDARIKATSEPFEWRLHDFRRSLSTSLHERFGVSPHVVEALLGHVGGVKAGVAGVYNKAIYLEERRRALARWSEHLLALTEGRTSEAKIVKLR
jgi:integrase